MANKNLTRFEETVLIFLLVIVAIVLILYVSFLDKAEITFAPTLSQHEGMLILDYGNNKMRWFKGEVVQGMTAFDVLQAANLSENLNIQFNHQVAAIEGIVSNSQKQWQCYVNDNFIQSDLSKIQVSPQDKILCQYK